MTNQREPARSGAEIDVAPRGVVVLHCPDPDRAACVHERATHAAIARRLATLKGFGFAGDHDPTRRWPGPVYFVPADTLLGTEARELGIGGEDDLFGGVVPYPFVATKVITHPLVEPEAAAPAGWSHDFGREVHEAVLRGFSVFTPEDARRAGRRLLEHGPVRVKPVRVAGGRGQAVAADGAALDALLAALDPAELARHGLVLEEDLADVTTVSVGQVRVAGLVASYHGTQRLTSDNDGAEVYGGSDLTVVRGDWDALLGLDLPESVRLAVAQARLYDAAASACFPGLFASRRNYDVAQGRDAAGCERSGVLEQSWRIGGASGAEIAALAAFRADPASTVVRASTFEVYGTGEAPARATVHFRGIDERLGPLVKYTLVGTDVDTGRGDRDPN